MYIPRKYRPEFPIATGERWLVQFQRPSRAERLADCALRNSAYRQAHAHQHALRTLVRPDGTIVSQQSGTSSH